MKRREYKEVDTCSAPPGRSSLGVDFAILDVH